MKIKTKQTSETIIELVIPAFYKDVQCSESINNMRAILDEKTAVDVWESEGRTCVSNGDVGLYSNNIVDAQLSWKPITEDEFMTAYNRALHSMSLTPELSKTV